MRTSLFLSTLFAVSLIGGAALAEKSQGGATPREPRAVERVRAHGDTVDKVYHAAEKAVRPAAASSTPAMPSNKAPYGGKTPGAKGENRVNCSDTGVDCLAAKGKAQSTGAPGAGDPAGHASRAPAFLDKVLGSDRTNFNEIGEDQGMSLHAVKRAWSSAAASHKGSDVALPISQERQVDRKSQQASEARMSCNEADECSMSNKAMRKVWANASIQAGTWSGPAKEPVSNAQRRIAAQRAAEGATATRAEHQASHGAGGGGAAQAADPH